MLALAFQQPPRDLVAQHPTAALLVFAVPALLVTIGGAIYTGRTRSPLFVWCAIAAATVYPFLTEAIGDHLIAVWYPENHYVAATVFGRPIAWIVVFFYLAFLPSLSVAAYSLAKRSNPRRLLALAATVGVMECTFEMVCSHYQWMHYYANPATIFGVPIYCLAQNGGFLVVVAWVLAVMLPRTHGWRWALIPVGLMLALGGLALAGTWPAYLAIHADASTAVIWLAALVSTALNAAIVVCFAYSPQLRRLREAAAHQPAPGTARARATASRAPAHADVGAR